MNQACSLLGGLGLGAGLMYFFDPDKGRRRRALLRDQFAHAASRFDDCVSATWKDVSQRTAGIAAETKALFTADEATDEVIAERVGSKIGRYVSHPAAIHVAVSEGRVTLTGAVLAHEVDNL